MKKRPRFDDDLAVHCRARGLPDPVREFRFHPTRRWLFDWAFPDLMIAVEKEGVVFPKPGRRDNGWAATLGIPVQAAEHRLGGRHTSAKGFVEDVEKYAAAFVLGWTVLRVLPKHVRSGQAAVWVAERLTLSRCETTIANPSGLTKCPTPRTRTSGS